MIKQKRGQIGMPFNWIFAIIVGVVILFISIYAAVNFIGIGEQKIYTETAAKITTLLEPMGTGLASGKSAQINFKKDTRTFYECSSLGQFGKQTIAFSEKTFGEKFGEKGGKINTQKYIFVEEVVEGKQLFLFSKPFEMPFKIDDLIMISSENYCFYKAPNEIIDDIGGLNMQNIKFVDDLDECVGVSVCFNSAGCDIKVSGLCEGYGCESQYDYGRVVKNGKELYYYGGLLYGAVISSPEIYECNVKRLMKKFVELSGVYIDKIDIIEIKGCSSRIKPDLINMKSLARGLDTSSGLFLLSQKAKQVDLKNQGAVCELY